MARVQAIRCWFEDLWHGLTYRSGFEENRRSRWFYTLRTSRCAAGFHWPIQLNTEYYMGDPPEAPEQHWSCSTCGHHRPPYRAAFWSGRLWILAHPIAAIRYWSERPRMTSPSSAERTARVGRKGR